mmetsp:Transcript_3078/g.8689  ORF Transcript_3078/g.8689 Transcript_3078/m.8689 type:complete len:104 (-) Transcript_3078:1085-1396(-)
MVIFYAQYLDEDGDKVTFSTDLEWKEAFGVLSKTLPDKELDIFVTFDQRAQDFLSTWIAGEDEDDDWVFVEREGEPATTHCGPNRRRGENFQWLLPTISATQR